MKPTLEFLIQLTNKKNKEKQLENKRIQLAIDLEICPDCGGNLSQSILGCIFGYTKCNSCRKKFNTLSGYY